MMTDLTSLLSAPLPGPALIALVIAAPFLGSFLGLVAVRLPEGRPIGWARSACDACGMRLGAADLVPLVSYAVLRGRCRSCRTPISWRLPAIEIAALAVTLWTLAALGPQAAAGLVLASLGLGFALLVLSWIDMVHYILPDEITLPLVLAGLGVTAALGPGLIGLHAVGAAIGYGLIWLVRLVYRRARGREGIGLGDAKLMAAAGAWIGPFGLASVLLIGSLAGLAAALGLRLSGREITATTAIPFGPFLALGFWVTWLHGPLQPQALRLDSLF